jgi:hypothetical protein
MGARVWAALAVACLLAQPGWSNGGAARRGDAPLQTPPTLRFGPAQPLSVSEPGFAAAASLLRRQIAAATGLGLGEALRRRAGSPMVEFFPFEDSAFHLSAGGRFDLLARATRGSPKFAELVYAPGKLLGRSRDKLKRMTPSAALGYALALGSHTRLELEGGARVEYDQPAHREFALFARRSSRLVGYRRDSDVNPVVQLSLGHRF